MVFFLFFSLHSVATVCVLSVRATDAAAMLIEMTLVMERAASGRAMTREHVAPPLSGIA